MNEFLFIPFFSLQAVGSYVLGTLLSTLAMVLLGYLMFSQVTYRVAPDPMPAPLIVPEKGGRAPVEPAPAMV